MNIDHVLYGARDLDGAAQRLREEFGLDSFDGGKHAEWGTANRIVPLGEQYIEIIAVEDRESDSPVAAFLGSATKGGDRFVGVALAVSDIEEVAARLETPVGSGRRLTPEGTELSWRHAGVAEALTEQLPFFIQWDGGRDPQLRDSARDASLGLGRVEVGGDATRLAAWLGKDVDGLHVVSGEPGVRAVEVQTSDGVALVQ